MYRAIALLMISFSAGAWATEGKKVVVIGFDGADYQIVDQMLATGDLPNLSKLREMGGFAPLLPTNPPQTPVSWSTFATGINPGRTGIYDFIKRQPGTYLPDFALRGETKKKFLLGTNNVWVLPMAAGLLVLLLVVFLGRKRKPALKWSLSIGITAVVAYAIFYIAANWLPASIPAAYTVRQGTPIWQILQEKGKTATIIRLPVTFPAEPLAGEMVSGLAVPDIRGTVGKPSIYSNDASWAADDNQFSIELKLLEGEPPYQTTVLGPPNKLFYDREAARAAQLAGANYAIPKDYHADLEIRIQGDEVVPMVAGVAYPLRAKQWSDWVVFHYRINPLITLKSAGRFYLDYLENGKFKLYLSPLHLHPGTPVPLTWPHDLAQQIWQDEPYKTMGWALDTWSIGNGLMDEQHFLADVKLTVDRYEKLLVDFLEGNETDLFVQVFSFTDRIGHVLWRYWDEGHPSYDPETAPVYQEAIRDAYRRMDAIVGKAMALVDLKETVFVVCSDHGFSSWRYQFNFNTWLVANGYMKLKKNVLGMPMKLDDLQNKRTPLSFVDWANTKAYAMGLGQVFINLAGREAEGSVKPEEYEALCAQLAADFKAFTDPQTGLKPVREVYHRDQIYHGYDPDLTPDLRVATALNYRVSWETTLGGMPEQLTAINPRNWSGDHCSLDPRDVQGILFASVPIQVEDPAMVDLCPSILALMAVEHDISMDGKTLFSHRPAPK